MFVDRVKIYAKAGDGGNGCLSFRREKYVPRGGPDGGHGGRGGNITLCVDEDVNHLEHLFYRPRLVAGRGGHGRGKQQAGRAAENLIIPVPPGTFVRRLPDGGMVADLVAPGHEFVLCAGGDGGRGNSAFKSSVNQAPRRAEKGWPGEEGKFELELKLVADAGLVGFPNAGKSTLISRLTKARPKIAAYPFTTLHPVIGAIEFEDYRKIRIADIPGLVGGAHRNVGLGHGFLRHIERCRLLLILLDMAGSDGRDPLEDHAQLLKELKLYNPQILKKPRLAVANKMDLAASAANLKRFKRRFRMTIVPISAEKGDGVGNLLNLLKQKML